MPRVRNQAARQALPLIAALALIAAAFSCDIFVGNHFDYWFEYKEMDEDTFLGSWASQEEGQDYEKYVVCTKEGEDYLYEVVDWYPSSETLNTLQSGSYEIEKGPDYTEWCANILFHATSPNPGEYANEVIEFTEGKHFTLPSATCDDGERCFFKKDAPF